jgi:hypothetical protein
MSLAIMQTRTGVNSWKRCSVVSSKLTLLIELHCGREGQGETPADRESDDAAS